LYIEWGGRSQRKSRFRPGIHRGDTKGTGRSFILHAGRYRHREKRSPCRRNHLAWGC
jgi:hypothetical protein